MSLASKYASIVAGWTLDEASGTRADSIGTNDLTDNNTVGSAAGKFDNAADFEAGNSESLSRASNSTLQMGDTDFMVRCWVKFESQISPATVIVSKDDGSSQREYLLHWSDSGDRLKFSVFTNGGTEDTATADNFGAISDGVWLLIHAWHDSVNNQVGISVNGGTANTVSTTGTGDTSTAGFYVGRRESAGSPLYFDGLIDDVILMKGAFLDASERIADYNAGHGIRFLDWEIGLDDAYSSLTAGWTMDETSGTRADSINSNDLSDNNTVGYATGKFDNAADFEASNSEYLNCASSSDLSPGNIDFMVRCWVKIESWPGGGSGTYIVAKSSGIDNPTVNEYTLYVGHPFQDIRFAVHDASSNAGYVSTGTLSLDTWYLIHAWHDATNNELGIAVNAGTPVTAAWSNGVRTTGNGFFVGCEQLDLATPTAFYDGLLDDLCILQNYILNGEQRLLDYNGGTGIRFLDWAGGGTAYNVSVSDTAALSNLFSRQSDAIRAYSEVAGLANAYARTSDGNRSVSDLVGLADAFLRISDAARAYVDTLGAQDTYARAATALRAYIDSAGLRDSLLDNITFLRQVADNLGLTDALTILFHTLCQYAYRFRNDDGDESTATWIAAENTPITFAQEVNFRLRFGIAATQPDVATFVPKIQVRKVGDPDWSDIPVFP